MSVGVGRRARRDAWAGLPGSTGVKGDNPSSLLSPESPNSHLIEELPVSLES